MSTEELKKVEEELNKIVNRFLESYEFKDLAKLDLIREFLQVNEWGLALETLMDQLYDEGIEISRSDYESLGYGNCIRGESHEEWSFLEELVDDSL